MAHCGTVRLSAFEYVYFLNIAMSHFSQNLNWPRAFVAVALAVAVSAAGAG